MHRSLTVAASILMLLPACGAGDRAASSPRKTTPEATVPRLFEPFSKADVEEAFTQAGLALHVVPLNGVCEDWMLDEPLESDIQIVGTSECAATFVSVDPSLPEPQLAWWAGQDEAYCAVSLYATEAEAQEAAAAPEPDQSLTPSAEGWRTERVGNVIVLYKGQQMETPVRSALSRL